MRGVGGPGFWAPKITAMDALQVGGLKGWMVGVGMLIRYKGGRDMIFWGELTI